MLGVLIPRDATAGAQIAGVPSLRDKVTRYGTDPYEESSLPTNPEHLQPAHLPGAFVAAPAGTAARIPGINDHSGKFVIAGYPVSFDPDRQQWYADVVFADNHPLLFDQAPFLRLGLVAYQPTSYVPDGPPGDLRSSAVTVAEPAQLTPSRGITAREIGPDTIEITLNAAGSLGAGVRARWQIRKHDPAVWPNPNPDMCVDVGVADATRPDVVPATWTTPTTLIIKPQPGTTPAMRALLRKGRILVEEYRRGWSLDFVNAATDRVVFADTVDLPDIL
jgi:hypothetical protein